MVSLFVMRFYCVTKKLENSNNTSNTLESYYSLVIVALAVCNR